LLIGAGSKQAKKKAEETAEIGKQKANQASAETRSKAEELREKGKRELD
jgi:hypothetical protein